MKISEIVSCLETLAPPSYQESYDNAGLLTGQANLECRGALIALDATEEIILEAVSKGCNLVVAHHPLIFKGLKKINGNNYVEKAVIAAIKHDIAVYAIHTNLDNVLDGVNGKMADLIGLTNRKPLVPRESGLKKLFTFVPETGLEAVMNAVFQAGAGVIGNYSEASFAAEGTGSFKAGKGANPFVGKIGERHYEKEKKIEFIFPAYLQGKIVDALRKAHPYEEVAFDLVELANPHPRIGSGLCGELPEPLEETAFLEKIKGIFQTSVIRHTKLRGVKVKKIALCGGAGSFLISNALSENVDIFISSDIRYHEFFDANGQLVLADIGHFESERFTIDAIHEFLVEKFPTFAVLKTARITNPVQYFL